MAKNYKDNFNDADGVWRTVGGRRIFIKNGQDLASAMIESGKFKNLRSDYRKAVNEEKEKYKPQYKGVLDRYEKDEKFRNMLKDIDVKNRQHAQDDIEEYLNGNKGDWEEDGEFIRDLASGYNLELDDAKSMFNVMKADKDARDMQKKIDVSNKKSEAESSKRELLSKVYSQYPDISEEDEDYLNNLSYNELKQELKDRGWDKEPELNKSEKEASSDAKEYHNIPYKYGSYTPEEYTKAEVLEKDDKYTTLLIPNKLQPTMEQVKEWNNGKDIKVGDIVKAPYDYGNTYTKDKMHDFKVLETGKYPVLEGKDKIQLTNDQLKKFDNEYSKIERANTNNQELYNKYMKDANNYDKMKADYDKQEEAYQKEHDKLSDEWRKHKYGTPEYENAYKKLTEHSNQHYNETKDMSDKLFKQKEIKALEEQGEKVVFDNKGNLLFHPSYYDKDATRKIDFGIDVNSPTAIKDKQILDSVTGQLSDGIWENSPSQDKYWSNMNYEQHNNRITFATSDRGKYDEYRHRYIENPFSSKSDQEVKDYVANKIKQIAKIEMKDNPSVGSWDRNNTNKLDYLGYDEGITVADAYNLYDRLKGRTPKVQSSINDDIRRKAYEKYMKEHPGSKMTFEDFMK